MMHTSHTRFQKGKCPDRPPFSITCRAAGYGVAFQAHPARAQRGACNQPLPTRIGVSSSMVGTRGSGPSTSFIW